MSEKSYFDMEVIKKGIENFFTKWGLKVMVIFLLATVSILFLKLWEYHILDSVIILFFIELLAYVVVKILRKPEVHRNDELVAFFIGILALQAAWPIFMPRISLEDINQEVGIINADKKQYQMVREAIVKVKPPLFPIIVERDYPIANNLTRINYEHSSPNLDINIGHDERNINIKLNHVSGWSFDEISDRVKYLADKPFILPTIIEFENKNINNIYRIPKFQNYELYPYNYGYSFPIENQNNFPLEIYDISFSIYNNTEAWINLKKWIDGGYCVSPIYSWSNGSFAGAKVNGELTLISIEMFNSSNMSLQIGYIPLAPYETKFPNIIFEENVCGDTIKDNSSYTSYNISGKVKIDKITPFLENSNYFIILIRNINTTKLGTTYAFPNSQYKYDLAGLPGGYAQGNVVQINVCENVQNCTASKNITVDMKKGYNEVNFP